MNTRQIGTEKEKLAYEYLTAQGMKVLEQNFRCAGGEIDMIGIHKGYLVFVEIKYRKTSRYGSALDAVDSRKQQKICQVADYYRYRHHCEHNVPVRYDVVAIQGEEITWIQNAFPHVSTGRTRY